MFLVNRLTPVGKERNPEENSHTVVRALVVMEAKVLIGYNFEKCAWKTNNPNKKIKLVSFPEPEIVRIKPDY